MKKIVINLIIFFKWKCQTLNAGELRNGDLNVYLAIIKWLEKLANKKDSYFKKGRKYKDIGNDFNLKDLKKRILYYLYMCYN